MDGPKMLSGSELVAKGATKKVDGQLPEVGLKDVSPNGSWLEQKQIQSALEARKHLIAVERIEKSGSLSHAAWRDDLKLAEVTKQTGGHWHYIGHKRGKYLYLLPEEALFLMETNSLLLKHNDVTVSLQKAYPLCLSDMSIMQYKVYASLSRLGYRVFRHKEPTPETRTTTEEHKEVSTKIEQINSESHNIGNNNDSNMEVIENDASATANNDSNNATNNMHLKDIPESNEGAMNEEISVNGNDCTTLDNSVETGINTETIIGHSTVIVSVQTSEWDQEKNVLPAVVTDNVNENESNANESVIVPRMDIDDNANETTVIANETEDATTTIFGGNATVVNEPSNAVTLASCLYSIDELGTIRAIEQNAPMETDSADSNVVKTVINSTKNSVEDSSADNSFKNYQVELKHYDDQINKLKARKSSAGKKNNRSLDIQDFYKKQTVKVIVPEEKYLPRNIFLHKTEYTLNIDVVRSQNALNVTNDDSDSLESSSTAVRAMNPQRLSDVPQFSNFHNNSQPRYPFYHHQRPHYNPRPNFNNYSMRNLSNYYGHHSRFHQNSYLRHQYVVYNVNMPGPNNYRNHLNRQETIKKYHFDTIVNIAMRLKNSRALPHQVRALENLLNTYNLRYDTCIDITPDFEIVGTPDSAPDQKVIMLNDNKVIALDDEPQPKKPRLNDETVMYNSNVVKLKELAAKLKELHAKNLAVSRHRRVFSRAIKTFNNKFNAELYLDSNFDLVDRKTVVVDTSSDSEVVVVKEDKKTKKRKKLRNPYSILKCISKDVNVGASTSRQVPVLQTLSLNVINDSTSQSTGGNANIDCITIGDKDYDLLNSFYSARFPGNDDFCGAKLCSRLKARLDSLLHQTEYLYNFLKESRADFESWADIKLIIWKDIRENINLQRQQVEALSNDFFTNEAQIQPILGPECTDLRSALKKLAIIPTDREVPLETSLRIHFDVCNRDVHFRKSNPPKPNFRIVCYDESAPFPATEDVIALQVKYTDAVPTVFAFVGTSGSISYLQINSIDLPVIIHGSDLV